jgi:hypothetical protein
MGTASLRASKAWGITETFPSDVCALSLAAVVRVDSRKTLKIAQRAERKRPA